MDHGDITAEVKELIENGYYQAKKKNENFIFTLEDLCKGIKVFPNEINKICVSDAIYELSQYDVFGYSVENNIYKINWLQDDY